jgi:hypothetical protein
MQVVSLDCWKDIIIDLTKTYRAISFSHIYRELNREGDILSKKELW